MTRCCAITATTQQLLPCTSRHLLLQSGLRSLQRRRFGDSALTVGTPWRDAGPCNVRSPVSLRCFGGFGNEVEGGYLYAACWIWSVNQSVSHWMELRPELSTVSCV